ncbi:MAG: TolC family protein [Schlesneria sp.]
MRIHRTGIALTLALCFVPACRSASVAHRPASSIRVASDPAETRSRQNSTDATTRSAESADGAVAPSATDQLTGNEERDPAIVETTQSALANVQQVSAEAINDASVAPVSAISVSRFSIQSAVETALSQNPDLNSLRQAEGVGSATVGVAQTYPFNPFVQVRSTPYQRNTSGGSGPTFHYVLLMQQIQLGHQQQHREESACAALNSIRWNVLQAELLNVAQTERLYFAAVYQRGLRELANINAENNRQLLVILKRQLEEGQSTAADVAIVRLDARSTRQQQRIAEANFQTALLDLKRHLGLPPEMSLELDDDIIRWTWRPAESSQLAEMATARPDVMAARADVDTARANTNLANANRIPDVQIGPFYSRDDFGTVFLGFQGQMDIPVNNSGVPLLRQREAELNQQAVTSQNLATRARLEAIAAANRYERARQLMLENGDAPQAALPVELQRLEEQFKAGEVDILRVLQARNSLLQNQRADLDALNELLQAAVAVTASTGTPLEALIVNGVLRPDGATHE